MTPARLVSELATRIKEVAAQVRLPLEDSERLVEVEVLENYLPEDLFEDTSYLPFVLVELISIKDDKDGSEAQVGLTIGTYAKEIDGWRDCFHLMQVIRQDLLERRVIGRRFRLTGCQWELPDVQPRPFFYATALLTFDLYQPQEQLKKALKGFF